MDCIFEPPGIRPARLSFYDEVEGKDEFHEISMVHQVLSWSLENIQQKRLLWKKAKPIEQTFDSKEHYLRGFRWPLLEEVRATIQKQLGSMEVAPRSQATARELSCRSDDSSNFKTFELHISAGTYKPRTKDLVLLSAIEPKCLDDLQTALYTFGLVRYLGDTGGCTNDFVLTALVYGPDGSPEYCALRDGQTAWTILHVTSLATKLRIWETLEYLHSSEVQVPILQEIVQAEFDPALSDEDASFDEVELAVRKYCEDTIAMNLSQVEAVIGVVSGLVKRERPLIRLIQGPPGTGKTSLLLPLLSILGGMDYRVLMAAPTTAAICEVASRFVSEQMLGELMPRRSCMQFGAYFPALVIRGKKSRILNLGDVVLIGEEMDLAVNEILESIYLPSRVSRLVRASSASNGYNNSIEALKHFLTCALTEHDRPLSLVTHVRENLPNLSQSLITNARIMCQDLPSSVLRPITRRSIYEASLLIKQIVGYLNRHNLSDEEVRLWLSNGSARDLLPPPRGRSTEVLNFADFVKVKGIILQILEARPGCDVFAGEAPSEADLESLCIGHARLLFGTVAKGGCQSVAESGSFDSVVIDEAPQVPEAETLVITHSPKIQQVVLVGDHKQLSATVLSEVARDWQYGRSLFDRLYMLDYPCQMLDMQYRMHPDISFFPNYQFYDGHVKNGCNVLSEAYSSKAFQNTTLKAYSFLDITDGREQRDVGEQSYRNFVEVGIVMHLIARLNKVCADNATVLTVGVIAPYDGQVQELDRRLNDVKTKFPHVKAEVQLVDGFQAREKDVIILSAVRSNSECVLDFSPAHDRLSLAITRSRYCLWIVGNGNTLSSDNVWRSLIEDSKRRRCFLQPDEGMVRVIRKVKSDMDELEDLLKPTSCLLSNTLWQILSSNELIRTVRELKSKDARQLVLGAVFKLAGGHHRTNRPYLDRKLTGPHSEIAQVSPVGNLYLVWSVDVQFAPEVKQVLKFWDAVEVGQVPNLLARLDAAFATYTDAYVKMCTMRKGSSDRRKKIIAPMKWEHNGGFVRFKALMLARSAVQETVLEKAGVNESILAMKFYALNSGIARHLITAADGSSFCLPFEVDEDEELILRYGKSSFVLGRSGTGKTTVITTKLLRKQQHFRLAKHGFQERAEEVEEETLKALALSCSTKDEFLRQGVITRSPKLCAAIKHHINKVQRCLEAAESPATIGSKNAELVSLMVNLVQDDEDKLMGSIPDTFCDIPADCYPLVITYSKLLNMIEGSLENPFFSPAERAWKKRCGSVSNNLVAMALLNAKQAEGSNGQEPEDKWSARLGKKSPRVEVDFCRFYALYWSHFDNKLTKGFDASLVFTEFMSSIKGSLAALRSPRRFMGRSDYVDLAHQKSSMFAEEEREKIYSLYLRYEKLKTMTYNDYDLADFVMHLHSELEQRALQGRSLHYVYVDEVQDLTQVQIALLKYVCPDHQSGFMFAGDTAQTISKGVGFRFEDIRKLFYMEFVHRNMSVQPEYVVNSKYRAVPDMHYLTRNYRSHTGILKLANSLVEQIYHFFPYAIDRLQPETSFLQGEIPIFLQIGENHDLVTALFDGGDMGGGGCEFGAEQAILVRNEVRKEATLKSLKAKSKTCLVLTVEECKGLEFQDVLMYNFFADSGLEKKWRVLYDILPDGNYLSAGAGETKPIASSKFEPHKHNVLCSELKQLYVAVTRARQRLLIYDDNADVHGPILDYWKSGNLVQVQTLDESLVGKLRKKSSAQDWSTKGIELFDAKQFSNAKLCFHKAGDFLSARLAEAEEHMKEAGKPGLSLTNLRGHLQAACNIYLTLKKVDKAVMCCKHLQDYKQGGAILEKNQRLEKAGDCYSEGKHFLEAANAYRKKPCVKKYLDICLRARFFDEGMCFIKERTLKGIVIQGDVLAYVQRCADHFKKQNKVQEMMIHVKMFPSIELQRAFLRDNFKEELLELEEAAGNFWEAAKIAEVIGAWERSATLSRQAGDTQGEIDKLMRLAQLKLFWGGGNGNEQDHITRLEEITQVGASHATKLELVILRTFRDPTADIGLLLDIWSQAQRLKAPRLEIIAGRNALWHMLEVMLGKKGFFTAKIRCEGELVVPALRNFEAALESAQLLRVCKKLWVIWSKCIMSVLKGLKSFAHCDVSTRVADDPFVKACFDLLGVAQLSAGTFNLRYPKASWLRGQYPSGQVLSKKKFLTLALAYWLHEVFQVTDKIQAEMCKLHSSNGGDMEVQLEMAIEMVEMGQILQKMEVRKDSIGSYRMWSTRVQHVLSAYAGWRAPQSLSIVRVLDSMAKGACQGEEDGVAAVLTLYPFISQKCIDDMIQDEVATHAAVRHILASWSLFRSRTALESPSMLVSALERSVMGILHQPISFSGDAPSICFCMERATVAVCSVYTHLRGLLVPVSLAFSYMSGANQERFYSEAARAECVGQESLFPVIISLADEILCLLESREKPDFRLLVALLMLVLNVQNLEYILQPLQRWFMERYKMWGLHDALQREFLGPSEGALLGPLPRKLLRLFQAKHFTVAQLGIAFARAMVAQGDPLIVLTTRDEMALPDWYTPRTVTPVFLRNDTSGKPEFSLKDTIFDKGASDRLLSEHVFRSLECGNLENLARILSPQK